MKENLITTPTLHDVLLYINGFDSNIVDSSKYHNEIQIFGSPEIIEGEGIRLNPANQDHLEIPYKEQLTLTGDFTIESRFKIFSRSSNSSILFCNYNNYKTKGSLGIFITHPSYVNKYCLAFNGVFPFLVSNSIVEYNKVCHIAFIRKNDDYSLWVNKVKEVGGPYPLTPVGSSKEHITIGWADGFSYNEMYVDGYILGYRITKQALNPDQFI